jgi:hypothetical protein
VLLSISGVLTLSYSLSGKVIDSKGAVIEGATITLVNARLFATSGNDGTWSINVPLGVKPVFNKQSIPSPRFKGSRLYFMVTDESQDVKISLYRLNGSHIYDVINSKLTPGIYSVIPLRPSRSPNIYAVRVEIGENVINFRLPLVKNIRNDETSISNEQEIEFGDVGQLLKRNLVIDTLRVLKTGYIPSILPVTSYGDSMTVKLELFVPSYYLNPPNPCYNRFFVDKCIKGDPKSACGGNCTVANSCSPPEDASKSNLPKTFICPRFMLFSTEMIQAAIDDAKQYGWGDGEDPPFNYGVVGHDPDVGGLDDGPSSCCQCYQIIFKKPEPSSPQPPELPYPKPLIVQSFNTAASGPKGFDVFMGAGGYGAFNSCYKDPAFSNTSKFDEFIYDAFPYQNPGSGGISFLRCQECIKGWPPTAEALESAACQKKIEQLCNQALVNASAQITEDTRRSCIETNKLKSLYHQNWEVWAKRVRCPDNLTRVTGCRLKEDKLPLPIPSVKTPVDAKKNGTFSDGYHTTTMQDCCKPTCAWADWILNYKLIPDGDWNSFYSCDKNGKPITIE